MVTTASISMVQDAKMCRMVSDVLTRAASRTKTFVMGSSIVGTTWMKWSATLVSISSVIHNCHRLIIINLMSFFKFAPVFIIFGKYTV